MCGIAAIYAYHYAALEVDREELRRIRDAMSVRGPDGAGEWYSADGRVGLGHRRLAIIDLSEKAAQPMSSNDGKVIVTFNGEIYNHRELRAGLEKKGHRFQSNSDTEVILHLYQEMGGNMVHELRGMFAIALWDSTKNQLLLIRDPYGIKPLYYADDGWTVRAASQVKALLTSEKVSKLSEPAGIVSFFLMGSVLEPFTLYQEIRQVPAGSIVTVTNIGPSAPKKYFSVAEVHHKATVGATPRGCPQGRALRRQGPVPTHNVDDEIHTALLDSVRHHFVSDVPVGLFLSSGIDSGALAGLAQEAGFKNLRTVTLAFNEFEGTEQDEAPLAEEVAHLYGTKHSTVRLSRDEFHQELQKVFEAMDQPSIDGINTYFVSRAARQLGWKVALSGVGGDELFGGYPSFREIPRLVSAMAIPSRIPFLGNIFRYLFPLITYHLSLTTQNFSPKYSGLLKYGGTYHGAYFLKRGLFMPWELEAIMDKETARDGLRRLDLIKRFKEGIVPEPTTSFAHVAAFESSFYLRNQLLRDADWAGMAHSLEIRTPFVDAWLLKTVWPIVDADCRGAVSAPLHPKHLLTSCLQKPLPEKVLRRAKTGFGIPIKNWLDSDENFDEWCQVPTLTRPGCPWARRWAYRVMENQQGISKELVSV